MFKKGGKGGKGDTIHESISMAVINELQKQRKQNKTEFVKTVEIYN